MPKIVDKEQMRQAILSASLKVFLVGGIHKTTMDKIAKQAGIAKGTLYLYFKSKEELIETMTSQYFDTLKHKLIPEQLFSTPCLLLSHIEQSLDVTEIDNKFTPVIAEVFGPGFSSTTLRKKHDQFLMQASDFYMKNLQSLLDKELINNDLNPKSFSLLVISLIDAIILHKCLFQSKDSHYKQLKREVIKLLEMGLSIK